MPAALFRVTPTEETHIYSDAITLNPAQNQDMSNEPGPSPCRVVGLPLWLENRWYESVRDENSRAKTQLLCLGIVVALVSVLPLLASGTTSFGDAKAICRERAVMVRILPFDDAGGHLLFLQHAMNSMATFVSFCGYWTWLVASPHTLTVEVERLDRTRACSCRKCIFFWSVILSHYLRPVVCCSLLTQ